MPDPAESIVKEMPGWLAKAASVPSRLRKNAAAGGIITAMLSGVAVIASLTLIAKAASFFKDAAVAHRFGTSDSLDAFLLAFGFVSFLAAVVGGGLPEAFLPAYVELRHRRGLHRAQRLAVQAGLWNLLSLAALAVILFFAAPWIVEVTGRGFSAEKRALAVHSLRSLLPFLLLFGMTFHFATWLRAEKKFALAATVPLAPPVVIIASLMLAGNRADIGDLIAGTNAGVLLQLVVLVLILRRSMSERAGHFFTRWEPANRRMLGNAFPFLLGGLLMNSAVIIDQTMAAWLEPGSVAVLSFADKICGIVLALTATAASEAVFPFFAESVAKKEWHALRRNLLRITAAILAVAAPLAVGLIVFAPQITGLLFERGSFTHADTERVAAVLRFSAMQVPFYISGILASRVAISMQAARFTLIASIAAMVCNIVFNWLLMRPLGVGGIALSTAIVHLLSTIYLYTYIFRNVARRMRETPNRPRHD